ncbi:hypothetical protein [Pseudomonas syringae group genomosp. 3]|uniref:hypothetical protein n=1 Tax=Pseudomonas syringae group genomosp. 3 TaxID=251701 RepID=UPI0011EA6163|nr:hypothetical protein [Pseudomonas syringae group genomosp. 3]
MKKLTNSEVLARFEWLYLIKNKALPIDSAQIKFLETTKTFCALEVPDRFKKISYNSLKKYCSIINLPVHLRISDSSWDDILRLREEAYKSTIEFPADDKITGPEQLLTEMSKHMHRYETAYFSLFREIKSIAESDPYLTDLSRKRITQALSQSKSLHMTTFTNTARYEESASLKLIDGGKL